MSQSAGALVHVISADPFLNGYNSCGIPRTRNLKIGTPLTHPQPRAI